VRNRQGELENPSPSTIFDIHVRYLQLVPPEFKSKVKVLGDPNGPNFHKIGTVSVSWLRSVGKLLALFVLDP
jgi:hypothetical protein